MTTEICALGAGELAARIRAREISPVEVVDAALDRIEGVEPSLNACTVVLAEEGRARAREAEQALAQGREIGALHGVPVAVKDAIWVKGQPSTMGSRALADFRPTEDGTSVRRLRDAGAIVIAKTTNPVLCWAAYTRSDLYGVTRNPWDLTRTPGGSSGGSGAAVAAGMVPLALGTDSGGSIRIPAVFCGIAGMKPTRGVVPRTPGFDEWRTLNVVGPIARSIEDARLCLDVIAGPDASDDLSVPGRREPLSLDSQAKDLRIAWAPGVGSHAIEPSTVAAFEHALGALEGAGWQLEAACPEPWDLKELSIPIYRGETGSHVDGRLHLFDARVQQMLQVAADLRAKDYYDAQIRRAEYTRMWEEFFDRYDALLTPGFSMPPFAADPDGPVLIDGKPHDLDSDISYYDITTVANLTGGPAAAISTGLDANGLPVAVQVMTRRFSDDLCMRVAAAIQAVLPPPRTPVDVRQPPPDVMPRAHA